MEFICAASSRKSRECIQVAIVTEYCPRGSVLDLMHRRVNNKLSESEVLSIFTRICEIVMTLHSFDPPIAHRDLKVENVLITESNGFRLCDFGSATCLTYCPKTDRDRYRARSDIEKNTTLIYRSPEMVDLFSGKKIDEAVDIWALGCLLYKLAYYKDPFDTKLGIINCSYRIPKTPYSNNLRKFIKWLLNPDPDTRPTIFEVMSRLTQKQITPPIRKKKVPRAEYKARQKEIRGKPLPARPSPSNKADLFSMLDWQPNEGSESLQETTETKQETKENKTDDLVSLFPSSEAFGTPEVTQTELIGFTDSNSTGGQTIATDFGPFAEFKPETPQEKQSNTHHCHPMYSVTSKPPVCLLVLPLLPVVC